MPGRDGTGPLGSGPMTGRGLGLCTGNSASGYGPGSAFGNPYRRGYRQYAAAKNASFKTQKEMLQQQKELLQDRIELIDKQLNDL